MGPTRRKDWTLAALRRDRGLFALLGVCIILLGAALSPTGAFAMPADGKVICAFAGTEGAADKDAPLSTVSGHCAACLAARSGFADLPPVDPGQGAPAFQPPRRIAEPALLAIAATADGQSRPGDPPPLIRGPPSIA